MSLTRKGYLRLYLSGRHYLVHRLVWLFVTGHWPLGLIDHRDGDKTNNRFSNLRDADNRLNQQNQRTAHRDSHSGVLGVSRNGGRWKARIKFGGAQVTLGSYATPEEAHNAYIAAKRSLHEGCTL